MSGRRKVALARELEELGLRVQAHREELRREMEELARVGESLRTEHLRLMREPESIRLGTEPARRTNAMCARCLNSCKQDEAARIFHCARFEAI